MKKIAIWIRILANTRSLQRCAGRAWLGPACLAALIGAISARPARADSETNAASPPVLPRELFNSGTRELRAGKLPEAEELLQNTVASQDPGLQPPALYNLGYVRVAQGAELLKQSQDPGGRATQPHVDNLTSAAEGAIQKIDEAMASQNERQMIMAYLRGGGVHREINEATKAVRKALDGKQDILAKWQRAAGDFRSAAELQNDHGDAEFNAGATERAIADLIDKLNKLQQAAMRMNAAGQLLGEKLKKLRGMIPAPDMPPGAPGDDDDDDMPGMKPGEKEGANKTGQEIKISASEAKDVLNGYKLGAGRHLRLSNEETNRPKAFTGKNW